jgi:hypothetical protein
MNDGKRKTSPESIKALEIEPLYNMPGPLTSGLALPLIQDHQLICGLRSMTTNEFVVNSRVPGFDPWPNPLVLDVLYNYCN